MFCEKCGVQLAEGQKFCTRCGAPVTPVGSAPAPSCQPPQYQQPSYQPPVYRTPAPQPVQTGSPVPGKKGNPVMILVIVAAVVLILGIGAGVVALGSKLLGFSGISDPASQVQPGTQQEEQEEQEEQHRSGWFVSEMRSYDKEGALAKREEYTYDLLGRLIKFQRYNRDGKATQYDEFVYHLSGGYTVTTRINESDRVYIVETYDAADNRVLRVVYNEDGTESVRYEEEYDARGNLLRKYAMESAKDFEGSTEYTYDGQGNLIQYVVWSKDVEQARFTYAYDEQGRLIREEQIPNPEVDPYAYLEVYTYTYNADGTVRREHTCDGRYYDHDILLYDEAGREILNLHFFNKGELGYSTETVYDEEGRLLCLREVDGYDTYPNFVYGRSVLTYGRIYDYTYNDRGDEVYKDYYYYGKLQVREETFYRDDGQPMYKTVVNGDGKLTSEVFFVYDETGNLLSRCFTNENREIVTDAEVYNCYMYTYDDNGNMTSEAYYYDRENRQYYYEYDYIFIP